MKYALIILLNFCVYLGTSQGCYPDGESFFSQTSLENGISDNPGCKVIEGFLTLSSNVNNLIPLANIEVIQGTLTIRTSCTSLAGLESIDSIYGDLIIISNNELLDISAIENIKFLGGDFILKLNPTLITAPIFSNLESFNGTTIEVASNNQLQTLPSFPNLTELNGHIIVSKLPLSNLKGLENWNRLNQLSILENANLNSTEDISSLLEITNSLVLSNNPMLTTLTLPSLTHIGGLNINAQRNITTIVANQLISIDGEISLNDSYELQGIDLPKLQRIGGDLKLDETVTITEVSLPELLVIGGDLHLRGTENLTVLNVPKIDSIVGKLNIVVTELADLSFPNLQFAQDVFISSNGLIETVDFSSLNAVGENFKILDSNLPEVLILENLESVGEEFYFEGCKGIKTLTINTTSFGDYITVEQNPDLTNLNFTFLESQDKIFISRNDELVDINLPQLRTCNTILFKGKNIESINIDNLEQVDAYLTLGEMHSLSTVNLNKLERSGTISISQAGNLGEMTFSKLDSVYGSFGIYADSMPGLFAPKLKYIGEDLGFGSPHLSIVEMPVLNEIGDGFSVNGTNVMLKNISLPDLETVGSIDFRINDYLQDLNFESLTRINSFLNLQSLDSLEHIDLNNLEYLSSCSLTSLPMLSNFNTPNLDSIVGNFTFRGCESLEFINMDKLSVANNFLSISDCDNLKELDFPSLVYLGSWCRFDGNMNVENIRLPILEVIPEELTIEWNISLTNLEIPMLDSIEVLFFEANKGYQNLNLDNLKYVESIILKRNDSLSTCSFKNLDVGSLIFIQDNEMLSSLDFSNEKDLSSDLTIEQNDALSELLINGIENIGGLLELKSNNALTSIEWPNLNSIGSVQIQNFDGLQTWDVPKLKTIFGKTEIQFNDELNTINWPQLENIEGAVSIKSNEKLMVMNNNSLETISGEFKIQDNLILEDIIYPKLNFIDGLVWFLHNVELTNLEMMSLSNINGELVFDGNIKLTTLAGVANIDPSSINRVVGRDLNIRNNTLLSFCDVPSICGVILDPEKEVLITGNAEGCDKVESLDCEGVAFGGTVFYDSNNNGVRDLGENGVPNFALNIEETGVLTYPKANGSYQQFGEDGSSYTITIELEDIWEITTSEESYSFVFEKGAAGFTNFDFGIIHSEPVHDGKVNMTSEFTRCNTDVNFMISYQHLSGGFDDIDVVYIQFEIDPKSTFISSSIPLESLDQNVGLIRVENVFTFDKINVDLVIEMPDETATGDIISYKVEAYIMDQAETIDLDSYDYESIVRCSYDPNDKQVNPVGVYEDNYTLWDEVLTYTVRFQNTGNTEALDVEILDTIDMSLDLQTLSVLSSSHDVVTTIRDRQVSFLFEGINLPDSTSNEPESHGFITYEIMANEIIPDPTMIQNTAHIIFDGNPAIITNTAKNTLVETIPTLNIEEEERETFILKPNPASNSVTIDVEGFQYAEIFDITGRMILATNNANIDISNLKDQSYIIRVKTSKKVILSKLIVVK